MQAGDDMRASASESSVLMVIAGSVAGAALLLGGGQGGLGDLATQLAAVVLLAWLCLDRSGHRLPPWVWWPIVAALALPVLQVLPLPASVWSQLGGRAGLAQELAVAGVPPPSRLGLDPVASERAGAWLLPGIALYLATLRMRARQQHRLLALVIALAVASVVVGLAQVTGGAASEWRFHARTNASGMVGFFANRNHAATFLAACLPFATVFAVRAWRDDPRNPLRVAVTIGVFVLLLAGLWMTQSRAGFAIGFAMLCLSPLLFDADTADRASGRRRAILAFAALLVAGAATLAAIGQSATGALDGGRSVQHATTIDAAEHYLPAGSGLGTFRLAYAPFERVSASGADHVIVNHAHNDYLELWLEAGWLALPVMLALLGFFAWSASRAFRDRAREGPWRRAAAVSLLAPALHSALDYPLRTTAHIALCGVLLAVVAGTAVQAAREEAG